MAKRIGIEAAWAANKGGMVNTTPVKYACTIHCLGKDGNYYRLKPGLIYLPEAGAALVSKINAKRTIDPDLWERTGGTQNDPDWSRTTADAEYRDAND